jgi:hypothetical protein
MNGSYQEITDYIEKLDNAPEETVPTAKAHEIKLLKQQNRALWEIARQLAKKFQDL